MGVQGLWELLAPVGRRVSVETLGGKKLAVDASIWIIQFMKAMRDDKGDMIRNAHLLGFFRRICKLLYLRAKPVFVFDGATPALKRRTVIARRRQRERAQSNVRKTAEKLLLNHLRTRKLEEIAQDIGLSQLEKKEQNLESERTRTKENKANGTDDAQKSSSVPCTVGTTEDTVSGQSTVDVNVVTEAANGVWTGSSVTGSKGDKQFNVLDGTTVVPSDESDDENNEEYFMLPATQGHFDPAVLASLPPSMQLNLLVQMREQQVAENRQKFRKVAQDPTSFSQLQIEAYLKTVAFRRDINEVQKAATGKGIGGIPTARIASEADREYIFSTTFTGGKDVQAQSVEATSNVTQCEDNNTVGSIQKYMETHSNVPITIDDSQSNSVAEGMGLQESCPGTKVADRVGSGESDVEWEDGVADIVYMDNDAKWEDGSGAGIRCDGDSDVKWGYGRGTTVTQEGLFGVKWGDEAGVAATHGGESDIEWGGGSGAAPMWEGDSEVKWGDEAGLAATHGGDSGVEREDGSGAFISAGEGASVEATLTEVEAAELQEAIRRSLEDFGSAKPYFGSSQLVIREQRDDHVNRRDVLPEAATTSLPNCEDTFLVRERERKGKAIIDNFEGDGRSSRKTSQGRLECGTILAEADKDGQLSFLGLATANNDKQSSLDEESLALQGVEKLSSASEQTFFASANEECEPSFKAGSVGERHAVSSETQVESSESLEVKIMQEQYIHSSAEGHVKAGSTHEQKVSEIQLHDMNIISDVRVGGLENVNKLDGRAVNHEENHAFVSDTEVSKAGLDPVLESEQKCSTLQSDNRNCNSDFYDEEKFQDALLKEAEKLDIYKEREALAKRETDVLEEKEELSRQKAELQAEMEAEQAAIQASIQDERDLLLQEEMELRAAQRKNERNAESVTGEMFSECQELLQMFGLPYIIAPMEAEAQCAFMDSIGLVDGVVTDDCDVFLFGGRNVFKNIFDDRKYVETYYMKDVESELGLDQDKLIHMALLLGSDYTEGISGIGIVNAIEVVHAFQGEIGLQKFKEWLDAPDVSLLGKLHQKGQKKESRKKRKQATDNDSRIDIEDPSMNRGTEAEEIDNEKPEFSEFNEQQQVFIEKHRAVSKNWNVPESFPSVNVITAYKVPQVDKSTESFSWGRPDLEALRGLCFDRFGWNKSKADELLLPVLKEYDRHETQLRLEAFYTFNQRFAKIRSNRIQKAVTRITGHRSSELMDFPPDDTESPPTKKPRRNKAQNAAKKVTVDGSEQALNTSPTNSYVSQEEKLVGLKRKKAKDTSQVKGRAVDPCKRGRGRGRGRMTSRGRAKVQAKASGRSLLTDSADISSSDESPSNDTEDLEKGKQRSRVDGKQLRKSTRLPQRTVYQFSGSDKDDSDSHEVGGETMTSRNDCPVLIENVASSSFQQCENSRSPQPLVNGTIDVDLSKAVADKKESLLVHEDTDYLVTGGGFCIIDKEEQETQDRPSSLAGSDRCPDYLTSSTDVLGFSNAGLARSSSPKASSSSVIETSGEVEYSLRAVPLLRRKKRQLN